MIASFVAAVSDAFAAASLVERSSRFSLGEVGAVESQSLQRVRVAPQARNGKLFRLA